MSKKILLDFDGVCNTYNGEYNQNVLPPIRNGLEDFLKSLKELGYTIIIFTARKPIKKIVEWFINYGLGDYIYDVTNIKEPAQLYLDDSGITFKGDFNESLKTIKEFKTYWKTSSKLRFIARKIII
jgi:hypothetical protein